jgi:23S rRNA (adenine2503-C2)-methyltransferase
MSDPVTNPVKIQFYSLTAEDLSRRVAELGWPTFRARQLMDWVYGKGVDNPETMSNFAKSDRAKIAETFTFSMSTILRRQTSEDGTEKLLLGWPGGAVAETVMIPDANRRTACVSSQVGCPVGCKFCASGLEGVKGNLTADQIVEQVIALNRILRSQGTGTRGQQQKSVSHLTPDPSPLTPSSSITNIVFMGMGEPMANYANVMQAVRVLHDSNGLNIGARRITISTVGVPAKMRELAEENLPLNLALSLHAPNEPLRKELIPWAEHFALDEILEATRYYFDRTGREITLEYILLASVNDRPEHAIQLARLCRTMRANVNLIRYNEVEPLPYKRPKSQDVLAFQEILRNAGVNAHVRKSRGRDIAAACGQLRRKEQVESGVVQLGIAR